MRTTVTLDPDTEAIVRRVIREEGKGFKEALNQAIRAGVAPSSGAVVHLPKRPMGRPRVELDNALQLIGELEDGEVLHKSRIGK